MGFWLYPAVFCTSALSAMGVGGGTLLLAVLAVFSDAAPEDIRFLNLFLFLPIAVLSLILHSRAGLVSWRAVFWSLPAGLLGVLLGLLCSAWLGQKGFKTAFAIFLLLIGLKELFSAPKKAAG